MVEIDLKELTIRNQELYRLGTLLGVDIDSPTEIYTKSEIKEVREALEKAKFDAALSSSPSDDPKNILVNGLLHGSSPSNDEKQAIRDVLGRADDTMKLLDGMADRQEEGFHNNFYELARTLGVELDPPNKDPNAVSYTQAEVKQVSDAYKIFSDKSPEDTIHRLADEITRISPGLDPSNVDSVAINALANMDYLMVKAGGQPMNAPVNASAQQQSVTRTVGIDANGNEIASDPRILRLEQALAEIVPTLNSLTNTSFMNLKPYSNAPIPVNVDGFLDSESLASYKGAIKHLNHLATIANPFRDEPVDSFVSGNADDIKELLQSKVTESIDTVNNEIKRLEAQSSPDSAAIAAAKAEKASLRELKYSTIPQVIRDIASLDAEGLLSNHVDVKNIVTQIPAPSNSAVGVASEPNSPQEPPVTPQSKIPTSTDASGAKMSEAEMDAQDAKDALGGHIKSVEQILFALGEKIDEFDKFGLSESIITPLTEKDLGDKDANGNNVFGVNSQDMLSKAMVLIKTIDGEKNPNGLYSVGDGERLKRAILTQDALQPLRDELGMKQMHPDVAKVYFGNTVGISDEDKAQREAYKAKVDKDLNLGTSKDKLSLNGFITSLDAISSAGLIDEKKAQQTTKMNIMLDGAFLAMDKFAPGMSDMLKDFFTNSEFGQMIGSILSMFGVNVNRLWGDKNDLGVEAARPIVEKGFDLFVDAAKNELGADDFAAVMAQAKVDMLDKLNSPEGMAGKAQKFVFDKVMDQIFDGKSEEFIEQAITNAMDAAAAAGNYDAAKTAFSDSLIKAGADYQANSDLTLDQISATLTSTAALAQSPEIQSVVKEQIEAGNITPATPTTPVENKNLIDAGKDTHVALLFTPDTAEYDQNPLRLSNGRVRDIVAGLSLIGASISPDMVKDKNGEFLDIATPNVSALIEESLIRAEVYALKAEGVEITQEVLDGITNRKVTSENIDVTVPTLTYFMREQLENMDEVLLDEKIDKMNDAFKSLASDVGNHPQGLSALDQSFLSGQFDVNMANFAPHSNVVIPTKVDASASTAEIDKATVVEDTMALVEETEETTNITMNGAGDGAGITINSNNGVIIIDNSITNITINNGLDTVFNKSAACGIETPETFKDLCRLTASQAATFKELGIDIKEEFEKAIPVKDNGISRFVILDPSAHNVQGAELPDLVIGMRHGDNIYYCAVYYGEDYIKPISEQRLAGISDIGQVNNPFGARRLDDFLDQISVSSGGVILNSANSANGFYGIDFISPNGNGGTMIENGMRAVYGDIIDEKRITERYSGAYQIRHNARTSYEQVERDRLHTQGVPQDKVRPVIESVGQNLTPNKEEQPKEEEKGFFSRLFGGSSDDASNSSAEAMVKENAGDINADAANDAMYNPHNAGVLNLARPAGR